MAGLAIAADQKVHARSESQAGVNVWGYRGTVAHTKAPDEIRLAMFGGTRAFGWGVAPGETTLSSVRQLVTQALDTRGSVGRKYTAINLGVQGATPDQYARTIRRFAYLAPDYVCLFDDLRAPGTEPWPLAGSGLFEVTGYAPALPLALEEKGMAITYGDLAAAYRRDSSAADRRAMPLRAAGAALAGTGRALTAIDQALGRVVTRPSAGASSATAAMAEAIDAALGISRGVVVIAGPCDDAAECARQADLETLIRERYAENGRVRYVSLSRVPDLYSANLRLDGVNFSVAGNMRAAEAIAPAVLSLIANRRQS